MRLQDFPIGARFEYEGAFYVKTGPLTASSEQGKQRIIPRHANLRSLEMLAAEGKRTASSDSVQVLAAFDVFYASCRGWVNEVHHDVLAKAREQFIKALG